MADRLISEETLTSIADAIREKTGSTELILTEDMAQGVVDSYDSGRKLFTSRIDNTLIKVTEADLKGATGLRSYCFYNCTKLQEIELPEGFYAVNDNVFNKCTNLKKVTFCSHWINYIGDVAFAGTSKLAAVCLLKHKTPPSLSSSTFNYSSEFAKIIVDNSKVDTFKSATNWSNHAHRIVGADPNDEIGIIDINYPDGTFMMSFCFVKGWTWMDLKDSEFGHIINDSGTYIHDIDLAFNEDVEVPVVWRDVYGEMYYLDVANAEEVITEGTYNTFAG